MKTPEYQLTKSQIRKITQAEKITRPTDDEFKARAKKEHRPWGILKRDWIVGQMTLTEDYQRGLGQGRVDAANGIEYTEDRPTGAFNLGYYRGYTNYRSDRHGWDAATCERFDRMYVIGQEG